MQDAGVGRDFQINEFLALALRKANEFVPSESGSIFLDDPASKFPLIPEMSHLAAVACFGPRARGLLGRRLPAARGIVGQVYVSGQAYYSRDVAKDPHFWAALDKEVGYRTRSILCVPVTIRMSTVGVLELLNKMGKRPFSEKDFELLKIFADYISASIQNALDAQRHSELAKRDALTGLANDRQLHTALRKEVVRSWETKQELAFLFLDLDGFKAINDEFGHLAGSRLLFEVAEIIRQETGSWARVTAARYGGDEYAVILPGASVIEATEIAERLRVAIERAVFLKESTADVPALHVTDKITVSIGLATLLRHVGRADGNALLKFADEAMYASKHNGRNRITVYGPKLSVYGTDRFKDQ
jgi:diguanylate cyclase (GGDEF)-like protein